MIILDNKNIPNILAVQINSLIIIKKKNALIEKDILVTYKSR